MVPTHMDSMVALELERLALKPEVLVPLDEQIYRYDLTMKSLLDLPDDSPAVLAIDHLLSSVLSEKITT